MTCGCEPVGISEIVDRLATSRSTIDTWINRGLMPDRDWTVGGRPAWNWPTLVARLEADGMIVDGKVRPRGRPPSD